MNTTVSRLAQQQRHLLRRCWTSIGSSSSSFCSVSGSTSSSTAAIDTAASTTTALPTAPSPTPWSSWSMILPITNNASTTPTITTIRSFATTSGGGDGDGDGDDKDTPAENPSTETDAAAEAEAETDKDQEQHEPSAAEEFLLGDDTEVETPEKPLVIDLDSHSNADTDSYDPFEITRSFGDTSYYYYPPTHEQNDPKVLQARYEGMTNEELLDGSTIPPEVDPQSGVNHTWDSLIHSPPVRDKNKNLPRGTLVGTVVSTKMQKTINVAVDRYKVHKKYRKRMRYTRKFMAHDENEVASDGDLVMIVPSQRISKKKHFVLREILRAKGQL